MAIERRTESLPIRFRPAEPADESLIWDTWLRSFRDGATGARMPAHVFFAYYRRLFERLLERADTGILVATSERDSDRLYGWLCFSDTFLPQWACVHWGYVKGMYRRQGIMRALARYAGIGPDTQLVYTLSTRRVRRLASKLEGHAYLPVEEFLK